MQRGRRGRWENDVEWGRSRNRRGSNWKHREGEERADRFTDHHHRGDGRHWEVEEGEITPASESYAASFRDNHGRRGLFE